MDDMTEIPSYKKFLKVILSNKNKLENRATVELSERALTCVVLQKIVHHKLKAHYPLHC